MKITKGDKILISIALFINLLSIPYAFTFQKEGDNLIVEADNKLIGVYSLKKEQLIHVKGELGITDIEIKNGQAGIVKSPCLHKIGIKMGWIKHTGKIAACIPNKIVIRVEGNNADNIDAIVG